jgi:hypothetical protein
MQPAMMAQLFTGHDFLHAEWVSAVSLGGRFVARPSLQAEFEAVLSLGENQGSNP